MSIFGQSSARETHRLLSAAATDNATVAAARPCLLKGIQGRNNKASAVYLKLYDKLTAPTSADTPKKTLYLPATSIFDFSFGDGYEFSSGLGFRMTLGEADADATALLAGDVLGLNIDYR